MDALCRTILNSAQSKGKGKADAPNGAALLEHALTLTTAVREANQQELRGVTRCKQFGNAGQVLLNKALQESAKVCAPELSALLTAAVLLLSGATKIAAAVQEANDSGASNASAAATFSHTDIKECASLCARLAGDCMEPIARLAVSNAACSDAPVLAFLAELESGFSQLGPAFRRVGVDAINFATIVGTASSAAWPLASRVIAAAVASLGRVRRTGPGGEQAGNNKTGNAVAYEPAPYVRALLGAVEQHLLVARQAAQQ